MGHAFRLQGVDHEVWLARAGGTYRVHVGAVDLPATLVARGEHVHELTVHDACERAVVARRGDEVHVHLDGEAYVLRHVPSLERFAGPAADDGAAVARAPMPGSVIAVGVEVGAAVRRGQPLLVIESMKMETTITAPCDGTAQIVHVAVGQTFDRDAPLVTLQRSGAAA